MNNTTEEKREAIPNSVSRMLLAGIGVLLQVLWIFWLALKLNDYSTAIQVCTSVLTFLITLRIYGLHINSAYKISWIILILLFPIFGLTIYLLFGRSGAVSVMRRRFGENMTMLRRYHAPTLQQRRALPYPDRITRNHARYLQDRAGYPAYDNTDVTFYGDTCEALEAQKTALRSAEKFIFMEYHAIEDASAWQELEDILAERAAHGVEVRVFYDDVGSIGFINSKFVKKLAGRGIQCRRFNPVIPILNVFMNNRDHRKITVVDGRVGFTGGYNLAEEYFNRTHPYGQWKDSGIRLEGAAVRGLPLFAAGYPFFGINVVTIGYYQSIERGRLATGLTVLRGIVLMAFCFLVLPRLAGVAGIWLAVPAAELAVTLLLLVLLRIGYGMRR